MSMVPQWPAAKVEDIPTTPEVVDALGDPAAIKRKFPCMCEDCLSRGIVVPNSYEDEMRYEQEAWPF